MFVRGFLLFLAICCSSAAAYYLSSGYSSMDDDFYGQPYRVASYGFTQPIVRRVGGYPSWQYGRAFPRSVGVQLNYGLNTIGGGGYYYEDVFKKK